LILQGRVIELEKKVDLIREHRDALDKAREAAEKRIAKLENEKAEFDAGAPRHAS
jgi:hypothetical protein